VGDRQRGASLAVVYSNCLFCSASLGRNEVIEHFPIGRRLAFDAAHGRLWAVCAHCRQWCLTPIEERWEAIEECERQFRTTTRRVSTDQIGLARLREGLELIRIGEPLRPEMAAWRYGPQLNRRRRRALLAAGSAVAIVGGALVGGVVLGVAASVPITVAWNARALVQQLGGHQVIARIPAGSRHAFTVRRAAAAKSLIEPGEAPGSWRLHLHHDGGVRFFEGPAGLRAARHLLAGVNQFGATSAQVRGAVDMLSVVTDPAEYFPFVAARQRTLGGLAVTRLPHSVRLALEMAAHDEVERRAMEGELHELAEAWRQAEEIAAIADDLFLPPSVDAFLRRHR
jgi:hypothetical protein